MGVVFLFMMGVAELWWVRKFVGAVGNTVISMLFYTQ